MKIGLSLKVARASDAPRIEREASELLRTYTSTSMSLVTEGNFLPIKMLMNADNHITYKNTRRTYRLSGSGIVEKSLSDSPQFYGESKNIPYYIESGSVIDIRRKRVVYMILVPKERKPHLLLEMAINTKIGSRAVDLPEGVILYEHPELVRLGGRYNTLRLPYKKLVRSMFPEESITSDIKVIQDIVIPKIPRNLSIAEMNTIMQNANSKLADIVI